MKVEEEVAVAEEVKAVKQESISSESESEEEAEYHPNVSVSISHTQIPEEKEEEEEQEKKEEEKTAEQDMTVPDAPSLPAEVSQPVEAPGREGEESQREDAEAEKKNAEEEKEGARETEESTDDPMVTPDEAPNGITLPEERVTVTVAPAEEEEEPKMNGEASLVEAEPRPQVICCSEVKSSLGRLRIFPGFWSLLPTVETPTFFPSCLPQCRYPSCLREYLSPMYILTLIYALL